VLGATIHNKDLKDGFGSVYLPYALNKKYPNADKTFNWQYVFPSRRIATDPRTNIKRRHHVDQFNGVTLSFLPLPSRTVICLNSKSISCTRRCTASVLLNTIRIRGSLRERAALTRKNKNYSQQRFKRWLW
jgi:hypothetical protein